MRRKAGAQLFTAVLKGALQQRMKVLGQRGARLMRRKLNNRTGDFRLWPKTSWSNFGDHVYARVKLRHHAEQAHLAGVGRGIQPLRNFALNGDMHSHAIWKVIEQNGDQRSGRLIRQICDHAKWPVVDGGRDQWVE